MNDIILNNACLTVYNNSKQIKHIIYVYKGKVYQLNKLWELKRIEAALTRLGSTYWEIGI